ncbi:MAG: hypothetical protein GF372_11195 [Candidatus Marinimicrobia bacterium]|nr:hypothetical protein [Candidatus Neomarinimicrobiota bacterium]
MKVICCSCGISLGERDSTAFEQDAISHGLCDSCSHSFMAQIGMPLDEYLGGIEAPVTVVTPEGRIATANAKGFELLGKNFNEIHGEKGGDVFDCEYARLPEGCGETIHCSGCTIRNTVMATLETGEVQRNVPAILNKHAEDGTKRFDLLISTEQKGGVVFLTILEIAEYVPA